MIPVQEAGVLPDKGPLVTSYADASAILTAAAELEARLNPGSVKLHNNAAFSPRP